MGQRTFMEFFSNPEFYGIWPRNGTAKSILKVLNHIGYFIEQKTDLQIWGSAVLFSHTLGKPQGTRHCIARHDGINRAQIILTLLRPPGPLPIPLPTSVTNNPYT